MEHIVNKINWQKAMNNCEYDEKVGIRIAKIAGNKEFSTYITAIDYTRSVTPHYHKIGDEHYHILEGEGKVILRNMINNEECTFSAYGGESFVVPANTLHQLINTGENKLILMFSCPENHLNSDRFFS